MVLAIMSAILVSLRLAKYYQLDTNKLFDLFFWLIIGGIIGARIYDIFLNFNYYLVNPLQTLEIWKGGLAIHGGIIAGIIITLLFTINNKLNFWKIGSVIIPGLALGQAIGRWGNYFNQELFGLPTNSFIGIPISIINRPAEYISSNYFQPTFLYESIGCFFIFIIMSALSYNFIKNNKLNTDFYIWSVSLYMILYSILRFFLEFIKIDATPHLFGLRFPQVMSLLLIFFFLLFILFHKHAREKNNSN